MTSLRERLIKTGARLARHTGYVIFEMAEIVQPNHVLADVLAPIDGPRWLPAETVSA